MSPGAVDRAPSSASRVPGPAGIQHDRPAATTASSSRSSCPTAQKAEGQPESLARAEVAPSPHDVTSMLTGVVAQGTATRAQIPGVDRGRQDGHDRELRRRLVRRLDARAHRRRVGRLPGRAQADGDRVQRRSPSPAAPTPPRSGKSFVRRPLASYKEYGRRRRTRTSDGRCRRARDDHAGHRRRRPRPPPTTPARRRPRPSGEGGDDAGRRRSSRRSDPAPEPTPAGAGAARRRRRAAAAAAGRRSSPRRHGTAPAAPRRPASG